MNIKIHRTITKNTLNKLRFVHKKFGTRLTAISFVEYCRHCYTISEAKFNVIHNNMNKHIFGILQLTSISLLTL